MEITAATLCRAVALLLFIAATFGIGANARFSLTAAGLAFLTLSFLVP